MNKVNVTIAVIAVLIIGAAAYVLWGNTGSTTIDNTDASQMPATTTPLNSGESPQPGDQVHGLPVEPAAAAARKDLAARLSVDEKSIVITQITDKTWNDGCLGLGGAAESCLAALVPGFQVALVAKGETYLYRTDKTGAAARFDGQIMAK